MILVRRRLPITLGLPLLPKNVLVIALTTLLTAGLAGWFPPAASASDWDDDDAPSFFFEGSTYFSLGYSLVNEDFEDKLGQKSKGKGFHRIANGVGNAKGVNVVFGKRIWKYLALESQFEYTDGFSEKKKPGDPVEGFQLSVYTVTLNTKIFPLHDILNSFNEGRLQPHVVTGMGLMVTKDLDIDTGASIAFRLGIGVDYFVYDRWAVNLRSAYVVPVGQLRGLQFVTTSVGLSYQLE
jgi:opacity protein-like surface antigen